MLLLVFNRSTRPPFSAPKRWMASMNGVPAGMRSNSVSMEVIFRPSVTCAESVCRCEVIGRAATEAAAVKKLRLFKMAPCPALTLVSRCQTDLGFDLAFVESNSESGFAGNGKVRAHRHRRVRFKVVIG